MSLGSLIVIIFLKSHYLSKIHTEILTEEINWEGSR